jgi:anaerobic selenocysteine-containing dehydrogenase
MRKYGAFEIRRGALKEFDRDLTDEEIRDSHVDPETGIIYSRTPAAPPKNIVPSPLPLSNESGRQTGIMIDGRAKFGFRTPSRKLEIFSDTLSEFGWRELALPEYIESHVHPRRINRDNGEFVLLSTYRLPTLIHTRSANAKWLVEISHSNPAWIHTSDAAQLGVTTGDLVRVSTAIGYFVDKVWVTEGIRPGVVACSHHLGRWRVAERDGVSQLASSLVQLDEKGSNWALSQLSGVGPYKSSDPDTERIWWTDAGVHQNLTFPVQPDPVSGSHCWHQKVHVARAHSGDRYGDIHVDTAKSQEIFREWLAKSRPAKGEWRRPHWMLRPFRPDVSAYRRNGNT